METRAKFVVMGLFTVVVAVGVLVFAAWLSAPERTADPMLLEVVFDGRAQGIRIGSDTLFNGIKVGDVKEIGFDPDNPRRVRVLISIERTTPIRSDVTASIQAMGITGTSAISLALGPGDAPPFVFKKGEVPVIVGEPPMLEALKQDLPQMLAKFNSLLNNVNVILEENRGNVSGITSDLHELTSAVAGYTNSLNRTFAHVEGTAASAEDFMERVDGLVESDGENIVQGLNDAISDFRNTLDGIDRLTGQANGMLAENRPAIDSFAAQGMAQIGNVMADLRRLLASLERIALKLEHDPSGFILGGADAQEYTTP